MDNVIKKAKQVKAQFLKNIFLPNKTPVNLKQEIFFVRGFQRSGTNWVSRLLNLHDDISCTGEFHFQHLFLGAEKLCSLRFWNQDKEKFEGKFHSFIEDYIIEINNKTKWVGDRTPTSINSTFIPNKKYILITRDGRDCIVSWFYHCLRMGITPNPKMKAKKSLFDSDKDYFERNKHELLEVPGFLQRLSIQWNNRILNDLKTIDKINKGEINAKVFWIKYEELLLDTEQVRKKMYQFLGADLIKFKALNEVTSPGFENHNPKSHNRKGESGRWKEYFTPKQHQIFLNNASRALEALSLSKEFNS